MPRKVNKDSCSFGGITRQFKDLNYMTDIDHTVSTGNKYLDRGIAKVGAMVLNKAVKDPRAKLIVKGTEKLYPYVEIGSANIARAKVAYDASCRKKK